MKWILLALLFLPVFADAQIITTFAGTGTAGFGGDGGPATIAQLQNPMGICFDSSDNLLFSDQYNNRIRKINSAHIINTIAGSGLPGIGAYSGDGGPATLANLNTPMDVGVDGIGNIYITDWVNERIRKIDNSGIITTICGEAGVGFSGDGGPATAAKINNPEAMAVDNEGNIYFDDRANYRYRKIDASGIITTIAGNGTMGYSGDDGPATAAELNPPYGGVVLGKEGLIYLSDGLNASVRKIDALGNISTFAGNGTMGYSGDGGPATAAQLGFVMSLAIDGCGNIYIADDVGNHRVRKVNALGIITTVAGNGVAGDSGDGGLATLAELGDIRGLGADRSGNLYISDFAYQKIRIVSSGNHPPAFINGHLQRLTVCGNTINNIDSLLRIFDLDTLQAETWNIIIPPAHGTIAGSYIATSTGDTLMPAGLSYSPAGGYSGIDSFKMTVSDCGYLSDTTTIYFTIENCALAINNNFVGGTLEMNVFPNPVYNVLNIAANHIINQVIINNLIGQTVFVKTSANLFKGEEKIQVNIADLPGGVYFVKINGTEVRKFVKE